MCTICGVLSHETVVKYFFVVIYALLCGEKLSQKLCLWRKKDKYHVCGDDDDRDDDEDLMMMMKLMKTMMIELTIPAQQCDLSGFYSPATELRNT